MQIQDWPIADVRPYPNNPRVLRNAAEKVAESIKAFGWRQPIVVDEQGVVIIGHSRLAAAKLLKLATVPVHVAAGLFGFFGDRPDPARLESAALLAAKRGPDGWGILTERSSEVGMGRLDAGTARRIDGERFVLGHCRLSTVIGTKHPGACQPIVVGRFAIAHNGTVANVRTLQEAFGFTLRTGNDSEAIAHLLNLLPGKTWRTWFEDVLAMWPPEQRQVIRSNVAEMIRLHNRKTRGRDIPDEVYDPVSGASWKFFCLVAIRGDLKNRRKGGMQLKGDQTRRKMGITLEEARAQVDGEL